MTKKYIKTHSIQFVDVFYSRKQERGQCGLLSGLGFAACQSKNPQSPQSPKLPLYKEILQFLPKLRISERNTKEKLAFLFIPEREELRQSQSYGKSRAKQKEFILFFCRDGVSSPSLMAKLRLQ